MESTNGLVPALFIVTFLIAIIFGVIQYRKTRKAQREHQGSALAEHNDRASNANSTSQP
jgi:hypothetical protein